jgi:hypothetical protein
VTFFVRFPKSRDERPGWMVRWLHNTESSSWWAETFVEAESAEEAAAKLSEYVDIDKHTSYRDKHRMKVRVYGPIPEEAREFTVSKATDVVPA